MLHTMLQRHGSRQPRLAAGTARALPTAHCADPAERPAALACLPSSRTSPRLAGTAESTSLKCNRAEQASAAGRHGQGSARGGGPAGRWPGPPTGSPACPCWTRRPPRRSSRPSACSPPGGPATAPEPPLAGRPQDERTYTQAAAARLVRFLGTVLSAVLRYMGCSGVRVWPPAPLATGATCACSLAPPAQAGAARAARPQGAPRARALGTIARNLGRVWSPNIRCSARLLRTVLRAPAVLKRSACSRMRRGPGWQARARRG